MEKIKEVRQTMENEAGTGQRGGQQELTGNYIRLVALWWGNFAFLPFSLFPVLLFPTPGRFSGCHALLSSSLPILDKYFGPGRNVPDGIDVALFCRH